MIPEDITLRPEKPDDFPQINSVTIKAFSNMEFSDGCEAEIINRLRNSPYFIPELSIVAEYNADILGHIIFTRNTIIGNEQNYGSLTLGPMSVNPEYQGMGIGKKLVNFGLQQAAILGYKSVIVLGHADYYPKFGFKPCSVYKIKCPFGVADEVFMALELEPKSLEKVSGTVEYPLEFFPDKMF